MDSLLTSFFNLLFPRVCPVCGKRLGRHDRGLCFSCLMALPLYPDSNFTDNSITAGLPGMVRISRATAVFCYFHGSELHRIIEKIKYGGRSDLAVEMGHIMADILIPKKFFEDADCIVPLPLHRKRQRERGYNQAELIARGLSEKSGICVADVLERTGNNKSQTSLTAVERLENVAGIFRLKDESFCLGKNIILIDDILTTGATIMSAAAELEGKCKSISILALAVTSG